MNITTLFILSVLGSLPFAAMWVVKFLKESADTPQDWKKWKKNWIPRKPRANVTSSEQALETSIPVKTKRTLRWWFRIIFAVYRILFWFFGTGFLWYLTRSKPGVPLTVDIAAMMILTAVFMVTSILHQDD